MPTTNTCAPTMMLERRADFAQPAKMLHTASSPHCFAFTDFPQARRAYTTPSMPCAFRWRDGRLPRSFDALPVTAARRAPDYRQYRRLRSHPQAYTSHAGTRARPQWPTRLATKRETRIHISPGIFKRDGPLRPISGHLYTPGRHCADAYIA